MPNRWQYVSLVVILHNRVKITVFFLFLQYERRKICFHQYLVGANPCHSAVAILKKMYTYELVVKM